VSGLVAVSTLLVVVVGITLTSASQNARSLQPALDSRKVAPLLDPPAGASALPPKTVVLYLVETVEQVQVAEWGESRAKAQAYRSYRVVPSEAELEFAVQNAVEDALRGETIHLQIVDMRELQSSNPP
jgi:hypothetical protein